MRKRRRDNATWTAWLSMMRRCTDPKAYNYKRYGGRGIKVCSRWSRMKGLHGFYNFQKDMGRRPPGKGLTLRDESLGYRPGNVTWGTHGDRARKRKNNIWVEMKGKRMVLKDWVRELGLSYLAVYARMQRGWKPVDALLVPFGLPPGPRPKGIVLTEQGEQHG